jgi:enterochelin esterase-like enzyme
VGLTSGSLIGLLFIVTAALVAGTVWMWPQRAGSRLRTLATRAGLLLSSHLALALAVLVTLNAHFLFFSSWDELIGTGGDGGVESAGEPLKPAGGKQPVTLAGNGTVTSSGGGAVGPALASMVTGRKITNPHPELNGDIEHVTVHGAISGIKADAYVELPAQYFQKPYAKRRFPTTVMLTGYPGNPRALIRLLHFPSIVHTGEVSGKVQPMIYVLMRPTVAPPRDTECTDIPGGPQVETFFGTDLPRAISAAFRANPNRNGWAMMGDSTGGYCAAKIAMRHSDRFSTAVSLSGYFHALKDITTGDLYGGSPAIRNENDLLWRAQHLPPPPINILVTSCKVGERTYPQAQAFLALARPPMRADSLLLDSGGHNYQTFARMLPGALGWLSSHLVGA